MNKLLKDEKIFIQFRNYFSIIFNDRIFDNELNNHFDKDGVLACFILAFLTNKISKARLLRLIKSDLENWLNLLTRLYLDDKIIETYKKLSLNPCIDFDKVLGSFSCFNNFIKYFKTFIDNNNLPIDFDDELIEKFIKKGLGFLLYNLIDCQIPNKLENILIDEKYDAKIQMIVYNTKLFSQIKNLILSNCEKNVNDFIVLILGMSKSLNQEY